MEHITPEILTQAREYLGKICLRIYENRDGEREYSIVNRNTGKEHHLPTGWTEEEAKSFFSSEMEGQKQKIMKQLLGDKYGLAGKTFDGHFWVERDGKIIDPILKDNIHIGKDSVRFHKEASLATQRLIIEAMYRTFEDKMRMKRDSDEWADMLLFHRPTVGACFHNAISEIFLRGGTLKCGSVGWYFKNGNTRDGFECPAGSVWWEYGCGNYITFKDFFKVAGTDLPDTYWTYEPERDEAKY